MTISFRLCRLISRQSLNARSKRRRVGLGAGDPRPNKGAGKDFLPRYGAKPRTEREPSGSFFSFVGDPEWRVFFARLDEGTQRLSSLVHIE